MTIRFFRQFSDTKLKSASQCQANVCKTRSDNNDKLAKATQKVMDKYKDPKFQNTPCASKASDLEKKGTLERFNNYRDAMPYANAANELNKLGDKNKLPKSENCITMLPLDGDELSKELGLTQGTITDADLRNDVTGFRAALFRNEADGSLILVARDTQPDSLVDWKTNTDNGQGRDTDQYEAMRELSGLLTTSGIKYNLAGYSKGGGLAQEAGLIAKNAKVRVFNSAGLHSASLQRTKTLSFDNLSKRTKSFSAEGDFLTFMNNTQDDTQQLLNAEFLRAELAGEGSGYNPMRIKVRNPEMRAASEQAGWFGDDPDPGFLDAKNTYLKDIDNMIEEARTKMDEEAERAKAEGRAPKNVLQMFPPVRASQHTELPNSIPWYNRESKVKNENPNLAKMIQHLMANVVSGLESTLDQDTKSLKEFIVSCG